jgi:hypothetical protein
VTFVGTGLRIAIVLATAAALQGCAAARGATRTAVPGTVVWRTGAGNLGQYDLPSANDGQCSFDRSKPGYVVPVVTGSNVSFTLLRNTDNTYTYEGKTYRGSSTCYRNQLNPRDPNTGTNSMLNPGSRYTFTFQTVVTLHGNTLNEGLGPGKGIAVDLPGIVWQTHSYGEGPTNGNGPCDMLLISNTQADRWTGLYPNSPPGGRPIWSFKTCSDSDNAVGRRYFSPDTLYDGEVDTWKIDIAAQLDGRSGGSVVVQRNGTVVYSAAAGVCDSHAYHGCWWNFGPYMYYWPNSNEPPGWNDAGITVQFKGMTLYKR